LSLRRSAPRTTFYTHTIMSVINDHPTLSIYTLSLHDALPILWIIAIVITIITIIYFVRDGRKKMKEKEQALQLAKERLAKGEISTKQYEEIRKRIQDES